MYHSRAHCSRASALGLSFWNVAGEDVADSDVIVCRLGALLEGKVRRMAESPEAGVRWGPRDRDRDVRVGGKNETNYVREVQRVLLNGSGVGVGDSDDRGLGPGEDDEVAGGPAIIVEVGVDGARSEADAKRVYVILVHSLS